MSKCFKNVFCSCILSGLACAAISSPASAACTTSDPCAPKRAQDAWSTSVALGLNLTSGNSETLLATALTNAYRETPADLIDTNLSYSFGQNESSTTQETETTKNEVRADASYNYRLTPRWYVGGGTKYLHDQLADIDYRVFVNPTLGYFLIKNDDFSLALEGGPSYIFEEVADVKNDYLAPRIADRFDWIISCTSKLFQKSEVLFDTDDTNNILVNSEVGVEAAISSSLSLVVALKDQYDNVPAPDREKNDFQAITALKLAL